MTHGSGGCSILKTDNWIPWLLIIIIITTFYSYYSENLLIFL